MKNIKIHILDDHDYFCELLKKMILDNKLCAVETFTDEIVFLNNMDKEPDLIFLDHNLKYYEGKYVLDIIKTMNSSPIIMYMSSDKDTFRYVENRYDKIHFLSKLDLNPAYLAQRLDEALMPLRRAS